MKSPKNRSGAPAEHPAQSIGLSRRRFIGTAGLAAATGLAIPTYVLADDDRGGNSRRCDVLVIGTGAAGLSAALAAHEQGADTVILEKGPFVGGTTLLSGGVFWIPNNSKMRDAGLNDPRADALSLMARLAYPQWYDPASPTLGLPQREFSLIEAFYDNAGPAIDFLESIGALQAGFNRDFTGQPFPDYFAEFPQNSAPRGRALEPRLQDGSPGFGFGLIQQLTAGVNTRGIPIELNTQVTGFLATGKGRIRGVITADGRRYRAKKGVVIAAGGFSQNEALSQTYLRGPIYGGCAAQTNQGDLIAPAQQAGADLGTMNEAWFYQVIFEQALQNRRVDVGVFFNSGDSMITVNKFGRRVVNEKAMYNERARVHFEWDPVRAEYSNLLLFYIYDQRTADLFPGFGGPVPLPGEAAPWVLASESLNGLADEIRQRLTQLSAHTGGFALDASFDQNLQQTVSDFAGYAVTGSDPEFNRGETLAENAFHGPPRPGNTLPNATMLPLSPTGPYYCIILAAGALDTHGGPKTDGDARVLDTAGVPIRGLYGAGNCVSSPAGQAYWSAGSTLGPALTFGVIAGRSAANT